LGKKNRSYAHGSSIVPMSRIAETIVIVEFIIQFIIQRKLIVGMSGHTISFMVIKITGGR